MSSLFALLLALTTMLGFWGLAWWLLKQPFPGTVEPMPSQSQWRNEPTSGHGSARRSPEIPPDVPVPRPRVHDDSDSNTQFFNRADSPRREKIAEETEILQDQPAATDRTAFLTNSYPKVVQTPPRAGS